MSTSYRPDAAGAIDIALFVPSLAGGGAERVFAHLANGFAQRGFRVALVLAAKKGPYIDEVADTVSLVDLRAKGVIKSIPALVRFLRVKRPQVLLAGLDNANISALLARRCARVAVRCVISMRSVPTAVYRHNPSTSRRLMLFLMRRFYPTADAIIANSRAVADDLQNNMRVPSEKLRVIYNPLDAAAVAQSALEPVRHAWLESQSPPVIISLGSLAILKDFPTLLKAFARVRAQRDCRLIILGEGPDRSALELLATQLGIASDVALPGFQKNPFAWISRSSVFVSASVTEGCPNALMQALACGTPVVTTDCVGGSAEIIEHGKWGRLVPVGDAQAMAEAINATLDDRSLPNVRERAADFSMDRIVQEYLDVLQPERV